MTKIDPPSLQLDRGDTAADNQQASVLQYASDPEASGAAEFATVTDSQGNTLFEQALPASKEITLTVPSDGKLTLSTRWTEGRTRQEMNLRELDPRLQPGQNVTLRLSESTKRYGIKLPLLSEIPVLGSLFRNQGASATGKLQPERLIILDGAGNTLYTGPASNSIDLDATDGTLDVSTHWSDGSTTREAITYQQRDVFADDWDDYVLINRDDSGHYALQPSSQARIGQVLIESVIIEAGTGRFRDHAPTIGVVTGVDEPLLHGAEEVDATSLNFGVTFDRWGRFRPKLEIDTRWGDETTRRVATGINSGWAYQAALSPGGNTGIASAGGTESSLETTYRSLTASLTLSRQFKDARDSDAAIEYYFAFGRSTRDYDGSIRLLSFPGVSSDDSLEVRTYDISAGLGLRGRHTFRNDWTLAGGVRLNALYYRGKYEGDHHYLCNV